MKPNSPVKAALALLAWIAITFLAPATGLIAPPGSWYSTLVKPSFNPPPWIFGPVWTLLYTLMAIAAWRVWLKGGWREQQRPLTLYLAQLALNASWTPVFFALHQLGWALVVIIALWLLIFATMRAFSSVDRTAGILFVPYLLWVSFASFLNFTLWRLNS